LPSDLFDLTRDDAAEGLDDLRVELAAGLVDDFLDGLPRRLALPVGSVRRDRVEGIGDGDDPSAQRDRLQRLAGRVRSPLEIAVVGDDDRDDLPQDLADFR